MTPFQRLHTLQAKATALRDEIVSTAAQLERHGPAVEILDAHDSLKTAADEMEEVLLAISEARKHEKDWRG